MASRGSTAGIRVNAVKLQKAIATETQKRMYDLIDEATRNKIVTSIFLEMCEPYVPIGSGEPPEYITRRRFNEDGEVVMVNPPEPGRLRASGRATEKLVIWGEGLPYAHYVYEGMVYGPNFPISGTDWETGSKVLKGWFSIPGQPKYPTGQKMEYYEWKPERHWDKAMLRDNRRLYNYRVTIAMRNLLK